MYYSLKDTHEWLSINMFRHLYADFPRGILEKGESPDFILKTGIKRTLGIEVTQLMDAERSSNYYYPAEHQSVKSEIIDNVRSFFEHKHSLKLNVFFHFKRKLSLKKSLIIPVSARLSKLVYNSIKGENFSHSFIKSLSPGEDFDFLNRISIFHDPETRISEWLLVDSYMVRSLSPEVLHKKISSKEEKLGLYMQKMLDNYWLLIMADFHREVISFNIDNQLERWKIHSRFNKVFILEKLAGKIYELQNINGH